MHIHIDVDHDDVLTDNPKRLHAIRAAAYFLLHAIGDLQDETTTETTRAGDVEHTITRTFPPKPPVPNTATAPASVTSVAPVAGNVPPPPTTVPAATVSNIPPPPPAPIFPAGLSGMGAPAQTNVLPPPPSPTQNHYHSESGDAGDYDDDETGDSNVVSFPTAGTVPPPPPANTAANPVVGAVATAVAASIAASVVTATTGTIEYDSAGMPWDARIHQKAKGKKKDNTWKLIKGIDTAIVQAVTAELAARKGAFAPVSLPGTNFTSTGTGAVGTYSVSVPPVANVPAPPGVPAPPASAPVPVPPSPAVGVVSSSPYRALIDKITEFTKAGKLAPAKVAEICQSHGAPSLMALNGMQTQMSVRDPGLTVVQGVDKDIDAAALGLL